MAFARLYTACAATLFLTPTTALAQTNHESSPDANGAVTHSATAPVAAIPSATAPANTNPSTSPILSVTLPPYARLRLDVNARDEDVLGLVKSFLRGFKGQNLQETIASMSRTRAADNKGSVEGLPTNDITKSAGIQLLSDADLETILSRIDHARFVVFETPNPYSGRGSSYGNNSYQGSRARATKAAQSTVAHYENTYLKRYGGRRIARGEFDDMQMLVVGFKERGFALVIGAPGMGVVIRANGYPNFEGLGPLIMGMGLLFAPQMR